MRELHAFSIALGLAVVSMPGVAAAAPRRPHKAARSTRVEGSPAELLRRGRALAAGGHNTEAVEVLDAALRATPHDPRVLNELGVVLRKTGALARAEARCREAATAEEPELRASALYNLGRVLEQRRDAAAAIAAYADSLRIRHTRAARERLITLDPTATTAMTQARPLDGPVASIEAWCSTQHAVQCDLHNEQLESSLVQADPSGPPDPRSPWSPGPHAPWEEIRVFVVQSDHTECGLGLRTTRGWFVGRVLDCEALHELRRRLELQLDDVIASARGAELQLELSSSEDFRTWDPVTHSSAASGSEFGALVICGVGPSAVPHCTSEVPLTPPLGDMEAGTGGLTPSWANGLLVLEPAAYGELAGRHRVIFP